MELGKLYIIDRGDYAGNIIQRSKLGGIDNVFVVGQNSGWSEVNTRYSFTITARRLQPSDLSVDLLAKLL